MDQDVVTHIVDYHYTIEKRGRKWFVGLLHRDKKKPLRDKILINEISNSWQVGMVVRIKARHEDRPTEFGHKVTIIPLEELPVSTK